MNATVLAASADLIHEVASLIEADGAERKEGAADFSSVLVVFPGKRPAHFLRRRLAAGMAGKTGGFIPPRILSMDELVNGVFDARSGGLSPLLEDIDAVALLHGIQLGAPDPIGGSSFMTLDSFFPLGLKIYQDLEELLIEGAVPEKVGEVQVLIEAEVPPRSRQSLGELARFYREFYPAVEKSGLSTRSSRYRAVCGSMEPKDLEDYQTIIMAGFFALTSSERNLFQRMGEWPQTRLLFQSGPGIKEKLGLLGIDGQKEKAVEPGPEVRFYSSPDAHGQVFALSAALQEAGEDTAVVLPAPETLFPLLRHCLSRFSEESYNVSLGYPLDRTPLFGFFTDLMALVDSIDGDRVYLPDYLTFVLHPYTKNIRFRASAEVTRILFHALEDHLAQSRTRAFSTLEELEADAKLFEKAARGVSAEAERIEPRELAAHLKDIHDRTVRRFLSFPSVREFAKRCIELIGWVHESSTAPSHPFFSRFSEEFVRSLEAISRSLMADKSFADASGYFTLLKRYLRTRHYPFPGTPLQGMQVLGALETRCLRFQRVFVLDADEGTLPPGGSDDTLLPFAVRMSLGLPTYRDRDDAAAYHFSLLAGGAKELHLFSVESGERQRSRFVERLLWERQKKDETLDESALVRPVQYRVSLENRAPAPVEKSAEIVERLKRGSFNATALDAYLSCPLKFYYSRVLGLGMREQATGEIEPVDIGKFVHEALLQYFTPLKGRVLTPEDADPHAMEAVVDELFRAKYGAGETGAARLLKNQFRSHLRDFVTHYLNDEVTAHRITLLDLEHTALAERGGFNLKGRLDAVMERDGAQWVADYKTAANPQYYRIRFDRLDPGDRETWSAAIPTLQLPFYLMLRPEASNAMFLLVGRSVLDRNIELPLFADEGEADKERPRLEQVIQGLLEEIVSPKVPFFPAADLKSACQYCDFTSICGTQWLG